MPRKAEPGLAATYSKPRVLMTSTMKSDPGRSVVQTSTRGGGGVVSAAVCLAPGSGFGVAGRCTSAASCAFAVSGFTTSGAAPAAAPAAAPFKKPRRSTEIFLDLAMVNPPYGVVLKVYGNIQYFIMLELAKRVSPPADILKVVGKETKLSEAHPVSAVRGCGSMDRDRPGDLERRESGRQASERSRAHGRFGDAAARWQFLASFRSSRGSSAHQLLGQLVRSLPA